jgi:glycosyltransferase involved in cell wall biosynthesis
MKLLIDGRSLHQTPVTGVQRYTRDIVAWLQRLDVGFDLWEPLRRPAFLGQFARQFLLPLSAWRYDVLFCPANLGPTRLSRKVRLVVTLNSLAVLARPEFYSPSFVAYYRLMMPRLIARADALITVSQAERVEILRLFRQAEGKLHVVPYGMDERFEHAGLPRQQRSTILFVGGDAVLKGISTLRDALARLQDIEGDLLIAGGRSGILKGQAELTFPPGRAVRFVQADEIEAMAQLYREAAVLVVPSRYESFGLPALEAMGSGCPVIASDLPALRETLGGAGLLVGAGDASALAAAMRQVLTDAALHDRLSAAGRQRAKQFSWRRCAEGTMAVLQKAMDA